MIPDRLETLELRREDGVLHIVLSRPAVRNAMNAEMVDELLEVFHALEEIGEAGTVVLRGAGGHFSAGGDLKGLSADREGVIGAEEVSVLKTNRAFGQLLLAVDRSPHVVVSAVEGSAMAGGLGLVCASDVCLATADSYFGAPEVTVGLVPAQIAPFVVARVGAPAARRLLLTGARLDGVEARELGLVDQLCADRVELETALELLLDRTRRCAPRAVAATKRLLARERVADPEARINHAARVFAEALHGDEAREGITAFLEKRPPAWPIPDDDRE